MRVFSLLALVAFLAACGESSSLPQRPETVRKCGELEGVEPVDPVVVGEYPVPYEDYGCPMFEPVPCVRPVSEYASLCGSECVPQTATGEDGDTWLLGCAWAMRGYGCGADYYANFCVVSPANSRAYWIGVNECDPWFLPITYCWSSCGEERDEEPAEWCP